MSDQEPIRCFGRPDDPLMARYHDQEWGVPLHDDRGLFEFMLLEGFQAGLSWRTILYKRENFRRAFDGFDADRIARSIFHLRFSFRTAVWRLIYT